jgi:hypothetical protein
MRQIRRARRLGPASEQQSPLPADPRDPDIVHAHQVAHCTSRSRAAMRSQAGTPSPHRSLEAGDASCPETPRPY